MSNKDVTTSFENYCRMIRDFSSCMNDYLYAYDIYSYPELKQMLLDELKEAKYPNVHIITNEED